MNGNGSMRHQKPVLVVAVAKKPAVGNDNLLAWSGGAFNIYPSAEIFSLPSIKSTATLNNRQVCFLCVHSPRGVSKEVFSSGAVRVVHMED
jgi:hypothetical protein